MLLPVLLLSVRDTITKICNLSLLSSHDVEWCPRKVILLIPQITSSKKLLEPHKLWYYNFLFRKKSKKSNKIKKYSEKRNSWKNGEVLGTLLLNFKKKTGLRVLRSQMPGSWSKFYIMPTSEYASISTACNAPR